MGDFYPIRVDLISGREVLAPAFRDQVIYLTGWELDNERVIIRVQGCYDLIVPSEAGKAKCIAAAQLLNLKSIE